MTERLLIVGGDAAGMTAAAPARRRRRPDELEIVGGVLGTAATKICRFEVARTGLNEKEAVGAGFDAFAASVDTTTRAGYLPGAASIRVRTVVETNSGRLLGAPIVGEEGQPSASTCSPPRSGTT